MFELSWKFISEPSLAAPDAGLVLMENRHALVAQESLTHVTGRPEREAALMLLDRQAGGRTLRADRGQDTQGFVDAVVARGIAPDSARNIHARRIGQLRHSAVLKALARTEGYLASQRIRIRIEGFGWIKQSVGLRQTKHRGIRRAATALSLAASDYNLVRLPKLLGQAA